MQLRERGALLGPDPVLRERGLRHLPDLQRLQRGDAGLQHLDQHLCRVHERCDLRGIDPGLQHLDEHLRGMHWRRDLRGIDALLQDLDEHLRGVPDHQ